MVQGDGSHHRQVRGDDVSAVQTASQTHFHDCDIHSLIGEPLEGQAGGNLEEREIQPVHQRSVAAEE